MSIPHVFRFLVSKIREFVQLKPKKKKQRNGANEHWTEIVCEDQIDFIYQAAREARVAALIAAKKPAKQSFINQSFECSPPHEKYYKYSDGSTKARFKRKKGDTDAKLQADRAALAAALARKPFKNY